MAIDASIYSQIRQPEAPNLLGQFAQAQQIQGLQDQNRLAQLAFQDRERQQADQTRRRGIYAANPEGGAGLENALLSGGFADESLKFGTARRANAKSDADTQRQRIDTAAKQIDLAGQLFGFVKNNPTPENAIAAITQLEQYGVWGPEQSARARAAVQQNPGSIAQLATQEYQGALSAKDQLAQYTTQNNGATTSILATNPVTGQVTTANTTTNTISPDARLSADTSTANSIRSSAATRDVAQATRDAATITKRGEGESKLRNEFNDLPEVKNLKLAIPAYQAIVKASESNNPQADINLIYGLAKLYDPTSVVREGEYGTIANSQTIPEWLKGQAQRLVGGGRLTPETKAQLMQQAKIRLDSYQSEVDGARRGYDEIARRGGLDPQNVFVPIGEQTRRNAPAGAAPSEFRIIGVEGQ